MWEHAPPTVAIALSNGDSPEALYLHSEGRACLQQAAEERQRVTPFRSPYRAVIKQNDTGEKLRETHFTHTSSVLDRYGKIRPAQSIPPVTARSFFVRRSRSTLLDLRSENSSS